MTERKHGRETVWRGEVARWYDALVGEGGSGYQRDVVFPGALRLLDARAGQRVLDLACGQGAFTRELARRGVDALGVDGSRELIERARGHVPPSRAAPSPDAKTRAPVPSPALSRGKEGQGGGARFRVLRADHLRELDAAGTFDGVACLLAIQNIEPIAPVFQACSEVLRPWGRLVVVMMHPSFRIPRQSGWAEDPARKLLYRRVDRYLSPLRVPIQVHPGAAPDVVAWAFHRPLQAYVAPLVEHGLLLDAVEEWPSTKTSQPGRRADAENRAREEFPLFLALRAVKVPRP